MQKSNVTVLKLIAARKIQTAREAYASKPHKLIHKSHQLALKPSKLTAFSGKLTPISLIFPSKNIAGIAI
jgi:hypothetical protein